MPPLDVLAAQAFRNMPIYKLDESLQMLKIVLLSRDRAHPISVRLTGIYLSLTLSIMKAPFIEKHKKSPVNYIVNIYAEPYSPDLKEMLQIVWSLLPMHLPRSIKGGETMAGSLAYCV
ncbi:MAG: hypothetical protein DRJ67_10705 [Thermoprotei archaeon]|nr:MAG: hypothetical protein DRJ67_10705 [Thermoprotei archaeon]